MWEELTEADLDRLTDSTDGAHDVRLNLGSRATATTPMAAMRTRVAAEAARFICAT